MNQQGVSCKFQFESEEEYFAQAMDEEVVREGRQISDHQIVALQSIIAKVSVNNEGLMAIEFANRAKEFISEVTALDKDEADSEVQIMGRKILRRMLEVALIVSAEPASRH